MKICSVYRPLAWSVPGVSFSHATTPRIVPEDQRVARAARGPSLRLVPHHGQLPCAKER